MNKQEEFEEFEEFEDGEDDAEDENGTTIPEDDEEEEEDEEEEVVEAPKPIKKKKVVEAPKVKQKSAVKETAQDIVDEQPEGQPQIQYVGVPRAVSIEEMINKIFDEVQELKQMVNALLTQNE